MKHASWPTFVATQGSELSVDELKSFLAKKLPDYMLPSACFVLPSLPLTSNGKVDRRALAGGRYANLELSARAVSPRNEAERAIADIWQEVLGLEKVGVYDNFFDLGGHSLLLAKVYTKLRQVFDRPLTVIDLFKYSTISSLGEFLTREQTEQPRFDKLFDRVGQTERSNQPAETAPQGEGTMSESYINDPIESIAIIGMSARFPKARDIAEFWRNLCDGVECIDFFSDEELRAEGVDEALLKNPNYVKAGALLEDAAYFDAPFFGYSPREAEIMDPQQRIFLEGAWAALEDAGYDPDTYDGAIGVYAGASFSHYSFGLYSNRELFGSMDSLQLILGNAESHLATRTSYKLNLKGPSVFVQSACSTSLVAVHLACQSLLNYQCKHGGGRRRLRHHAGEVGIRPPRGRRPVARRALPHLRRTGQRHDHR